MFQCHFFHIRHPKFPAYDLPRIFGVRSRRLPLWAKTRPIVLSQNIARNRQKSYNHANDYFVTLKKTQSNVNHRDIMLSDNSHHFSFILFRMTARSAAFCSLYCRAPPTLPLILFRCMKAKVLNGNKRENT